MVRNYNINIVRYPAKPGVEGVDYQKFDLLPDERARITIPNHLLERDEPIPVYQNGVLLNPR